MRTLARALDTVNGVTESAAMSVEALAVAVSTAFDISDDSRPSFLPIAYSSLPSGAERLLQVSTPQKPKAVCRSTFRVRHLDSRNEASTLVADVILTLSCDHHRYAANPPL